MGRHGHQQTAALVADSGWGVAWGGQSSRNSSDPSWVEREDGHCLYQVAPCGSSSDFLLVHFNLVCMYALSPPPPPLHTSSFLYFILSLTSLLTLPTLTLTSLHSLLTLLTYTIVDTENVFRLMVWVLDDRKKKQLHLLTPSHSHTEQSWSGYGQLFILQ